MPYALYIDESGSFDDQKRETKRSSLVAGWIAKHDNDHKNLRDTLVSWGEKVKKNRFHACEWRGDQNGRKILNNTFKLISEQRPYAVTCIEFSSANTSQDIYLEMLLELIIDAMIIIQKSGKSQNAFPLQVYVAERNTPIEQLKYILEYKISALSLDLKNKFRIHYRKLKLPGDFLLDKSSKNRSVDCLLPELVLADFLCNQLYRSKNLQVSFDDINAEHKQILVFQNDPFWRDVQFYNRQNIFERLITSISSSEGREWLDKHPLSKAEADILFSNAVKNCLLKDPRRVVELLKTEILATRDWEQAKLIITKINIQKSFIQPHLLPFVTWNVTMLSWDIANHMGNTKEAARQFNIFSSFLSKLEFQRTEFFREVPDFFNRHAVSLTDLYSFTKAEKIIHEAIKLERSYLATEVTINGKLLRPIYSDSLGKLYSTFGQLNTKLAVRDKTKSKKALHYFDEVDKHLQQSYECDRQMNYRIEALLAMEENCSEEIFKLLTKDNNEFTPKDLISLPHNSFRILFWLRWALRTTGYTDYIQQLLSLSNQFISLNGSFYPEGSILYHFGRLALLHKREDDALKAWLNAASINAETAEAFSPGVLDTLRLRPLCALSLNFPAYKELAKAEIMRIVTSIKSNSILNSSYFVEYIAEALNGELKDALLAKLELDIPYS